MAPKRKRPEASAEGGSTGTTVLYDYEDSVRFIVGGEKIVASRSVLALMSFKFQYMAEQVETEICFPNDDLEIMLLLFRIAYLKFSDLPESLSFRSLYGVATHCQRYDSTHLFKPFLNKYATPFESFTSEPGYEEWICIAWTLGLKGIFMKAVNALILKCDLKRSSWFATAEIFIHRLLFQSLGLKIRGH